MSRMRVGNREIRNAQVFEILLDNFPDIIHSVDKSGRIIFTNKKAESLLGYTHDELLSMNVRQIYADEILENLDRGFDELKQAGEYSIESVLKARDGTRIPVEIRSFSIYDDKGQFIRTFSILRDIRPIKELQRSLVHAGRLAAVGEMAAGIAHDIDNPLTVIMLANEVLSREVARGTLPDPADRLATFNRFIEETKRASQSIEKLVLHLRNFSRGVAEQREIVDLFDTIEDSLFIAQNRITGSRVTAEHSVNKGCHFTEGCPNQMEQVFVNLISNACDAMADRPTRRLTIGISGFKQDDKDYWKCDVADTGSGIPPHLLAEIFEAFFSTKEKGKGTGLGLSISRGIVKEHAGDIRVISEPGKGSTFSVLLPKANSPSSEAQLGHKGG